MGLSATTWKHIRRSPYHALAATLTMFLTLFMVGFFSVLSVGSEAIIRFFESKPQITVFLNDKAIKQDADSLSESLKQSGKTSTIKYVSKEEALVLYQKQNQDDPLLLEMVTADILPASLEVSATDPRYLEDLDRIIRQSEYVEEVVYQKDVVDSLIAWTNAVRIVGIVLAGILSLNSILVIMTITGLKLSLRKKEIEILTLVGASGWYIRFPFLIEGFFYGFIGSVLSWLLLLAGLIWSSPYLLSFLGVVPIFQAILSNPLSMVSVIFYLLLLSLLVLFGGILGIIGSMLTVNRYIKF